METGIVESSRHRGLALSLDNGSGKEGGVPRRNSERVFGEEKLKEASGVAPKMESELGEHVGKR